MNLIDEVNDLSVEALEVDSFVDELLVLEERAIGDDNPAASFKDDDK